MAVHNLKQKGGNMKLNNVFFNERGRTFQEVMNQFFVIYYNELLVENKPNNDIIDSY